MIRPASGSRRILSLALGSLALVLLGFVAVGAIGQTPPVNANAKIIAEFQKRIEAYAALHKKLESTLPALTKDVHAEEIDGHQRNLAGLIAKERVTAKQGDLFTPDMQAIVRDLVKQVFASGDAKALRASIMDDNPGPVKLTINGRYPDTVPMASMPPDVLKGLPPLPDSLEYRFVGETLVLFDPHAHTIADFVPNAVAQGLTSEDICASPDRFPACLGRCVRPDHRMPVAARRRRRRPRR